MDPLSDVIALLRPNTAISKPISGRGAWAVRYAAHDAPGFTIVLNGECWVTFEGEAPLKLETGAFLLLPTTPAFTLGSRPISWERPQSRWMCQFVTASRRARQIS